MAPPPVLRRARADRPAHGAAPVAAGRLQLGGADRLAAQLEAVPGLSRGERVAARAATSSGLDHGFAPAWRAGGGATRPRAQEHERRPRRAPSRPPWCRLRKSRTSSSTFRAAKAPAREQQRVPDARRDPAEQQDPPQRDARGAGGDEEEGADPRQEAVEDQEPGAPAPVAHLEAGELLREGVPAGRRPPAHARRQPRPDPVVDRRRRPSRPPSPRGRSPATTARRAPRTRPRARAAGRRGRAGRGTRGSSRRRG